MIKRSLAHSSRCLALAGAAAPGGLGGGRLLLLSIRCLALLSLWARPSRLLGSSHAGAQGLPVRAGGRGSGIGAACLLRLGVAIGGPLLLLLLGLVED